MGSRRSAASFQGGPGLQVEFKGWKGNVLRSVEGTLWRETPAGKSRRRAAYKKKTVIWGARDSDLSKFSDFGVVHRGDQTEPERWSDPKGLPDRGASRLRKEFPYAERRMTLGFLPQKKERARNNLVLNIGSRSRAKISKKNMVRRTS